MLVHLLRCLFVLHFHLTLCTSTVIKRAHFARQVEYCYVPCGQGWCCSFYEYCIPSPDPNNGFGPYQCVDELSVYAGGSSDIGFAQNPSMEASFLSQANPTTIVTTDSSMSYLPLESPYTPITWTESAPIISQTSALNSRLPTSANSLAASTSLSLEPGPITGLATATTSTIVSTKSASSGSVTITIGKSIVAIICFWVAWPIVRNGNL